MSEGKVTLSLEQVIQMMVRAIRANNTLGAASLGEAVLEALKEQKATEPASTPPAP